MEKIKSSYNHLQRQTTSHSYSHLLVGTHEHPARFNFHKADWHSYTILIDTYFNIFTITLYTIDNYNVFVSLIFAVAHVSIPLKKSSRKYPSSSPIWWTSFCTSVVRELLATFKKFRQSSSMSDFANYKRTCSIGRRTFKIVKKNASHQFCSFLNPLPHFRTFGSLLRSSNTVLYVPHCLITKNGFHIFVIG